MVLSDDLMKLYKSNKYLAHTPDAHEDRKRSETLEEHSLLCMKYFDKIDSIKHIKNKVYNILIQCGCLGEDLDYIWNMFRDAVFLHDIGKINPTYQYQRMKNKCFKELSIALDREADHALLSAYIYLNEYLKEIPLQEFNRKSSYVYAFAYCISRHHTYLKDIKDFHISLEKWIDNNVYSSNLKLNLPIFSRTDWVLKKEIKNEVAFYILSRLLYSLIIACDFYATSEYKCGKEVSLEVNAPFDVIYNRFKKTDRYQSIQKYRNQSKNDRTEVTNINQLRNQLFLEAEETLIDNIDKNIFYLEAPTGSGKTNISIDLFLNLTQKNPDIKNVFYIFPFNTLVEQTKNVLLSYIEPKDMCVINSLTPIIKDELESYENAYLNHIAMNYPLVVTSHVNLFYTLFGTSREQIFSLYQLCDSVIILDEIQSYSIGIWSELIIFLSNYANLLNIKVIIMSATLPRLDMLLEKQIDVVQLIKNPSYYNQNPFFKDRVKLDFSMADRKYSLEELAAVVMEYKDRKVLVEFFKKTTARKFYQIISELACDYTTVEELTGDDNVDAREKILYKIDNADHIIVVATQVIEAGVDIDMDIGFKDISIPDSDEQFLGRINRSCKKVESKVFFFHHDDAESIYKKSGQSDFRLKYAINKAEYVELFRNKEFTKIYELVLKDIKNFRNQKNAYSINTIYKDCRELDFQNVEKTMRLMESGYQIYLGYQLTRNNGEVVDGNALWQQYMDLCENTEMTYAEKQIKLSELYALMNLFTYNIMLSEEVECCGKRFGGYLYISDGENYLENGKFDRQKLLENCRRLIL